MLLKRGQAGRRRVIEGVNKAQSDGVVPRDAKSKL